MRHRTWMFLARIAAAAAVCMGAPVAQAQALAGGAGVGSGTDTDPVIFFYSGNCSSCAAAAGTGSFPVQATLMLQDYQPGDPITPANVLSLWYTGSNLVDMFSLHRPGEVMAAGRLFDAGTIASTSGQLGTNAGLPLAFSVEFADGLFFRTQADGSWSVCAPRGNGYASNCFGTGADAGTGRWLITPVPEPSVALLLAGGLAALSLLRRRVAQQQQQQSTRYSLAPIARARSR